MGLLVWIDGILEIENLPILVWFRNWSSILVNMCLNLVRFIIFSLLSPANPFALRYDYCLLWVSYFYKLSLYSSYGLNLSVILKKISAVVYSSWDLDLSYVELNEDGIIASCFLYSSFLIYLLLFPNMSLIWLFLIGIWKSLVVIDRSSIGLYCTVDIKSLGWSPYFFLIFVDSLVPII